MRHVFYCLIVFTCLFGGCFTGAEPPVAPVIPDEVTIEGSVIFWKGGFLANPIERHTGSNLTHVAIVLNEAGQTWVYEATYPRVRRVLYSDYIADLKEKETLPFWSHRDFSWFIYTLRWHIQRAN